MKKILITGASGFIGSFLVDEALNRNYEVYAGIRKTSNREYLVDSRIKFIELNFSEIELLSKEISAAPYFDFVIHNAGITKATKTEDYFTTNYQYTKNIIDVLIDLKRVPEKFIYMSSLAAYGPGSPTLLYPVKASDTPRPLTSYGKSKLKSEKFIATLSNFPHIIIRPTAVYGPREKDLLTVFKLINKNIELFVGFKKQHLTFVYVKDLVKAVFQATESDHVNKGYFVSDGYVYDGKILGNIIKEELGKKTIRINLPTKLVRWIAMINESTKYITKKQPVLNLDKINELASTNWKCDIKPLVDESNYNPTYNLTQGIHETIKWYKEFKWLK